MLALAFLIAALVLAICAAINIPSGRISLLAASLACYFIYLLIGKGGLGIG